MKRLATWLVLLLTGLPAFGQSNVIPGTDVSLGALSGLTSVGRTGGFPTGLNALAMATTSCNLGSVNVPWFATMQENHPLIGFLLARQEPGATRFVQISEYSHVKHGFFALSDNQCTPCQNPSNGTFLGVGCSDTYAVGNNGDNFYLGPAAEIDAWLGNWEATCSFFDKGLNPTPPFDCDGNRSLNSTQANSLLPVGNRVRVLDADLLQSSASYFYAAHYVVRGEPEANRTNNIGSRGFTPSWSGSKWNVPTSGSLQAGSVLSRWSGATVRSGTNGNDDGRVYVATKVTGPVNGLYHYEYALHNRDNSRQVAALRLPICAGTLVYNTGFKDVDQTAANNWTASIKGSELVFETSSNGLAWNSIYNFWFDSPAAPVNASVQLDELFPGPGASSFAVASVQVPGNNWVLSTGAGCALGTPGHFVPSAQPTVGNSSLQLLGVGFSPNSPAILYGSPLGGFLPIEGACAVYLGGSFGAEILEYGNGVSTAGGALNFGLPIPSNPNLEGLPFNFQALVLPVGGGPLFGVAELSDSLRLRLGGGSGCL